MILFNINGKTQRADCQVGDIIISLNKTEEYCLKLDGKTYNRVDFPELVEELEKIKSPQFKSSCLNVGDDKFKVPDFRELVLYGAIGNNEADSTNDAEFNLLQFKNDCMKNHYHTYKFFYPKHANDGNYSYGYNNARNYYDKELLRQDNNHYDAGIYEDNEVSTVTSGRKIGVYFHICYTGKRVKVGDKDIGVKRIIPTIRSDAKNMVEFKNRIPAQASINNAKNEMFSIRKQYTIKAKETQEDMLEFHHHKYVTFNLKWGTGQTGGGHWVIAEYLENEFEPSDYVSNARTGTVTREKGIGVFYEERGDKGLFNFNIKGKIISPYNTGQIIMSYDEHVDFAYLCDGQVLPDTEENKNLRNFLINLNKDFLIDNDNVKVPDFRELVLVGCGESDSSWNWIYRPELDDNHYGFTVLEFVDCLIQNHNHRIIQPLNGYYNNKKQFTTQQLVTAHNTWFLVDNNFTSSGKTTIQNPQLTQMTGNYVTQGKRIGVYYHICI